MLWAAVYLVMRRVLSPTPTTPAADDNASPSLPSSSFLVLNPMVPFMSSGINPTP